MPVSDWPGSPFRLKGAAHRFGPACPRLEILFVMTLDEYRSPSCETKCVKLFRNGEGRSFRWHFTFTNREPVYHLVASVKMQAGIAESRAFQIRTALLREAVPLSNISGSNLMVGRRRMATHLLLHELELLCDCRLKPRSQESWTLTGVSFSLQLDPRYNKVCYLKTSSAKFLLSRHPVFRVRECSTKKNGYTFPILSDNAISN